MCNHERIHIEDAIGASPDDTHNIGLDCENCGEHWERDGINHFVKVI